MADERTMLEYKVDLYGTHFTGLSGLLDETPAGEVDVINDIANQMANASARLAKAQSELDHFDRMDQWTNNYQPAEAEEADALNQKKEENWALVAMREREEEIKQEEKVDSLKELEREINCTPSGIRFNKYHVTDGTTKVRVRYSYSVNGRTVGRQLPYVTLYAKDYCDGLGILFGDLYINHTDTMTDYFDKGKVVLEEGHPCYDLALARAKEWEKQDAAEADEHFKATS